MGPPEDPPKKRRNQGKRRRRPIARRPRRRLCLLKGCKKTFRPDVATARYCSKECRLEADRWSQWKAQQKYRRTKKGKEKRQEQSRRYRQRVQKRKEDRVRVAREGNQGNFFLDNSCDRPGCYERLIQSRKSPLQRFCSKRCRRAVERVLERERRWREHRGS